MKVEERVRRNVAPYANVLETIGWTPLIRLNRVTNGIRTPVYAKAEFYNPGGSARTGSAPRSSRPPSGKVASARAA